MKLVAIVIVAGAGTSAADRAAPRRPAPKPPLACRATGPILFERDVVIDADGRRPPTTTQTFTIFGDGAWVRTEIDGDTKSTSNACLDKAQLRRLRLDLEAGPWKITRAQITCKAFSLRHVVYRWNGKQIFDDRICGADQLDAKSAKAFDDLVKLVDPLVTREVDPLNPIEE